MCFILFVLTQGRWLKLESGFFIYYFFFDKFYKFMVFLEEHIPEKRII